jgi:hypothetical protein
VLKPLRAALKNDPHVSGVKINESEYLLCQYPDDFALILGCDDKHSLEYLFVLDCE